VGDQGPGYQKGRPAGQAVYDGKRILPERVLGCGIETIVPKADERDFVHNSIFDELVPEVFRDEAKQRYLKLMDDLRGRGAEAIVLGCTEIPLLIKQADTDIPLFDSTLIHATYAVDFALAD
jgi:aspartate racemase